MNFLVPGSDRQRGTLAITLSFVVLGLLASCSVAPTPRKTLDVSEIADSTTPFQAEILEDGLVSEAEYERALLAQRSCVEDAGGIPGELIDIGNNERGFTYEVRAQSEEERVRIEGETDLCLTEYIDAVGQVWAYQQILTPSELDALRPEVAVCLRSVGLDVADDFTFDELFALTSSMSDGFEAIRPCVERYPEFFAVNPAEVQTDEDGHDH